MVAPREWMRPPRALLLLLFLLTFVSVSALAVFGWRLFAQQRIVEAQQSQDRLEQAADRITVMVREALARASERLRTGSLARGEVMLTLTADSLESSPPGQLLYYPFTAPDPEPRANIFAKAELFEFVESQLAEALAGYELLSHSPDSAIRAGALLRGARVLRKMGRNEQSLAVYRKLAESDESVAGAPARVVAMLAIAELSHKAEAAATLRAELGSGRSRLTRGQFEFYWAEANRLAGSDASPPANKLQASRIAEFVWNSRTAHTEPKGCEVERIGGEPVLLIWRDVEDERRVLVAKPDSLLSRHLMNPDVRYAFVDAEGHTLAGVKDKSNPWAVRTTAESELPWTIFVSEKKPVVKNRLTAQQQFLLLGLSIMILFLVLGTYFIAHAIQREADVQRMQSNFVSAVSHEFRSPVTSMRQLSEILALGRVSTEERRQLYYETLARESRRLQHLIEGLLNFGKMEARARQYQLKEHDAFDIVESVVGEFAPAVAANGKRIETSAVQVPLRIEADFDAISLALRNLLDNAIKYSPDQTTVWVQCGLEDGRVAIGVQDHGPGIPESERRTIFKKFIRGSAAQAANVKGTGIGLAMASEIVAAHGGQITVESELGRGSKFTMLLPPAERA